jgi:hypothetical protein
MMPSAAQPLSVEIQFSGKPYHMIVCSAAHKHSVLSATRYVQARMHLFLIGILSGVVLTSVPNAAWNCGGLMILGLTLIVCPFTTPQTTKMFGMHKSMILGRIVGCAVLLTALIMITKRF